VKIFDFAIPISQSVSYPHKKKEKKKKNTKKRKNNNLKVSFFYNI